MTKGKDIRVAIYYSKESTQYARLIGIEKFLSVLLQTYDSHRNKEINKMDRFCVTLPKDHENEQFFIYIL
ncbi:hypothetical protein Lal_00012385 [Lupinus albus]|nr:hypothetical protein Lal_00012385 [Lupinus albus]